MPNLPESRHFWRLAGASDDAWSEMMSSKLQFTANTPVEICCVKASAVKRVTWGATGQLLFSNTYTPPTELYDFSDFENWSAVPTPVGTFGFSSDSDYVTVGTSSLSVFAGSTGANGYGTIVNNSINLDMAGWSDLFIRAYREKTPGNASHIIELRLYDSSGVKATIRISGSGSTYPDELLEGWNWYHVRSTDSCVTTTGAVNYSAIVKAEIQLLAYGVYNGYTPIRVVFDSIAINGLRKPAIVLSWDDNNATDYNTALDLSSAGIKGNFYVIRDRIDTVGSITTAQLQEMYALGHDIGVHGWGNVQNVPSSTNWTHDLTVAAEEIADCVAYLNANGMSRSAVHCAYPEGAYNSSVIDLLKANGIKTARVITGRAYDPGPPVSNRTKSYKYGTQLPNGLIDDPYRLMATTFDSPKTLTNMQTIVSRECFQNGSSLMLHGHGYTFADRAQGQQLFAWLKEQESLGLCYVMTISEFYAACGGQ